MLPVVAVVYSHSHSDHYGGVRGLATDEEFASGKIKVYAPAGFTEHAVSENVIAGNVMSRRDLHVPRCCPATNTGASTAA